MLLHFTMILPFIRARSFNDKPREKLNHKTPIAVTSGKRSSAELVKLMAEHSGVIRRISELAE